MYGEREIPGAESRRGQLEALQYVSDVRVESEAAEAEFRRAELKRRAVRYCAVILRSLQLPLILPHTIFDPVL